MRFYTLLLLMVTGLSFNSFSQVVLKDVHGTIKLPSGTKRIPKSLDSSEASEEDKLQFKAEFSDFSYKNLLIDLSFNKVDTNLFGLDKIWQAKINRISRLGLEINNYPMTRKFYSNGNEGRIFASLQTTPNYLDIYLLNKESGIVFSGWIKFINSDKKSAYRYAKRLLKRVRFTE